MFHKVFKFFDYLVNKPASLVDVILTILNPIVSDKLFLKLKFRLQMGYWMDFSDPRTFNEKLQWLKLYDRKSEYTIMVDKVGAKEYVAEKIGKEYIIPTLGVWNNPDEIDLNKLPNKFVLKCSHNSGGLFICKDKSKLTDEEWEKVKVDLRKSLKVNFYSLFREWPYKNVPRRILAEKYMADANNIGDIEQLKDYKFFCFNGKVEYCKVDFDRFIDHHANYYDTFWSLQTFGEVVCRPKLDRIIEKPENYEKMIELAQQLAKNIPFVRIDFYNVQGHIYFGEITFFPAAGFGIFTPYETDLMLGEFINLPK